MFHTFVQCSKIKIIKKGLKDKKYDLKLSQKSHSPFTMEVLG